VHAQEVFNKLVANLQTRDRIIDKENNTLRVKVCCSVAWVFETQENKRQFWIDSVSDQLC
jgi:hypothetical protein